MKVIDKRSGMIHVLVRKIKKERKRIKSVLKSKKDKWKKKDFHPVELEKSAVGEDSHVSEAVFNSFISRFDVRKLKNSNNFVFKEGETTVGEIVDFFFPEGEKSEKKKK